MKPYYEADGIVIYHGDCREILPGFRADVIVTDPPYGVAWSRNPGTCQGGGRGHSGIEGDRDTTVRDEMLAMTTIPAIVFGSFYAPFPANVRQVLVWHKPTGSGVVGAVTGYRRDVEPVFLCGDWPVVAVARSGLLPAGETSSRRLAFETEHPHTKPVGLLRHLIAACPDGVVLDPFAGSGSTLVAARQLGRRAIGIEIDERYCEMAARRLAQMVFDVGDVAA